MAVCRIRAGGAAAAASTADRPRMAQRGFAALGKHRSAIRLDSFPPEPHTATVRSEGRHFDPSLPLESRHPQVGNARYDLFGLRPDAGGPYDDRPPARRPRNGSPA